MKRRSHNQKILKYVMLCVLIALPIMMYSQVPNYALVPEKKVYKTIGFSRLKLYIYQSAKRDDTVNLPAIVFFHGGGFNERPVKQFEAQCQYLVAQGIVAINASYRTNSRPFDCIADTKSAIRWVRAHAIELGIDENRIVAGGGSAGAYLAACTGLIKDFDEKNEDLTISSVPNALILFNPAVDFVEQTSKAEKLTYRLKKLRRSLKGRAIEISPFHNITKDAPPTIIFHGTDDESVPFHQVTRFCEKMKEYGNNCEVVLYEGRKHGFFLKYFGDEDFISTMEHTVKFLSSIGYINGDTTIIQ
jgi:acetyl esterase